MARDSAGNCELCGRPAVKLERHHLIPRTRHKNRKNKRDFTRQEVRERIVLLCGACHDTVHATLTTKELEGAFNTLEDLRAHPEIAKFIRWVRKNPPDRHVAVRLSRKARQAGGLDTREARKRKLDSR